MIPPTPKQLRVEKFIVQFSSEHGYAPSVRELAEHFKMTGPSMQGLLDRLQARGRITREPGRPRTLQVVRHG